MNSKSTPVFSFFRQSTCVSTWLIILFLGMANGLSAQSLDLSRAQIYTPIKDKKVLRRSVEVLREEVQKRTGTLLPLATKVPTDGRPLMYLTLQKEVPNLPAKYRQLLGQVPTLAAEGFSLVADPASNAVLLVAADARGVLYGVGQLLRKLELRPGQVLLPQPLRVTTSPKYPIRGHQLGYRPKTNSYDAFTVAQFDQYIRDLALFGANSIEILPPRTDDDFSSRHMKLPAIKMIAEQSRICDEYGLDVWMWYPNMNPTYEHPDSIQKELKERHEVFKAVPRLDHVFVPGGDPGDLEPDVLFGWLHQMAEVLHQYHPQAKIWVSPQVFRPNQAWFDAFFKHINAGYPWLGGVVFGPWVKMPVTEIRKVLKPGIPIRMYPDITHSLSSQFPVPHWDLAYAMTLGRECVNPRPYDEKMIHNALDEYASGSISYSEGTNDDLNKFVWSDQDWDPNRDVMETLRDYGRLFIGPDVAEAVAQGMVAQERNLRGPLLPNEGVLRTLTQWQAIEKQAAQQVPTNFRLQMGLLRAYYDAYVYRRLIYETELEQQAREYLRQAGTLGTQVAMEKARTTFEKATKYPVAPDYRQKCLELGELLYQSIGAQLTIEPHGAMSGRGNFLDNIDLPLNDVLWVMDQLSEVAKLPSEAERLRGIHALLHRTDPGPGGFYDNFGAPESWYRVVSDRSYEDDPGSLLSPRVSFGVGLIGEEWVHEVRATGFDGKATPRAWMHQVNTLYDTPLKIRYDGLDPTASYKIRVAHTGRFRSKIKLTTDDGSLIHDFIQTGRQPFYEFKVPQAANADGQIIFQWTCGEGERGAQVAELWLIRE
nr:hypothetical protein [Rhabdobacter roseus]